MRRYVYISEAKVEESYQQIPKRLRDRFEVKWKFDMKLVSLELQEKYPQQSLYSKLEFVLEHLDEQGKIGSVDHHEEYFGEPMPLKWGFDGVGFTEPIVYFGGHTDETVIGLGGSLKHVVGNVASRDPETLGSVGPSLLDVIRRAAERSSDIPTPDNPHHYGSYNQGGLSYLQCVEHVSNGMRGPEELMEFVAVELYSGIEPRSWVSLEDSTNPQWKIVLGTPLYVAYANKSQR